MLKIFRVEHRVTGVGPFQTVDPYTQKLANRLNDFPDLRFPGEDGLPLGQIPFSFVFGCLDLAQQKRWILLGESEEENQEILDALENKGFVLVEYLANDYRHSVSKFQIAFDAKSCKEEGNFKILDWGLLQEPVYS